MSLNEVIAGIILDSARQIQDVGEPINLSSTLREAGIETEPDIQAFKELMYRSYGAASANRTIEIGGDEVEIVILKLENDLNLKPETRLESVLATTFEIFRDQVKPTITIAEELPIDFDEMPTITIAEQHSFEDASPGGSLAGDTTKTGEP